MKISETLKEKSRLGIWNFRRIITPQKKPYCCSKTYKKPSLGNWKATRWERSKHAVHFWCFCIRCHATVGNTNSIKLYLMCPNMRLFGIISKTTTWAIEALDFTRRLPRWRMVTDKKNNKLWGFHIKVSPHRGGICFSATEARAIG